MYSSLLQVFDWRWSRKPNEDGHEYKDNLSKKQKGQLMLLLEL